MKPTTRKLIAVFRARKITDRAYAAKWHRDCRKVYGRRAMVESYLARS